MGRKRTPGLRKRGEFWHIEKQVKGYGRLYESTGESGLEEADKYLARRLEGIRAALVYGVRPHRPWRQAATKYLIDYAYKRSISRDAQALRLLDKFIGDLPLSRVHQGTLEPYISTRRKAGIKTATVNRDLAVVRRILNLAARLWRDENGLTWLEVPPMIQFLPVVDAREPYPLSWTEQKEFLKHLPGHLARMVLFKVNTGTREAEVCGLPWEWEIRVPELDTSVFIIPGSRVKNSEDRLVVLNRVARSVIEECRGRHPTHVFSYVPPGKGKESHPVGKMLNTAWKRARKEVGLPHLRVHDIKHTFGRRLRAAGVSLETRKVLLGHKTGDITTHYSAPELRELIAATEKVCEDKSGKNPALTMLRKRSCLG